MNQKSAFDCAIVERVKMDLLVLAVWVLCAYVAYSQAKKKGLNPGLWALIGLIFGVFGVIASLVARPKVNGLKNISSNMNLRNSGTSTLAGGVTGGAIGATAASGLTSSQQNAMSNLQDFAQQKIEEQNEEEDSGFDAGDMDF